MTPLAVIAAFLAAFAVGLLGTLAVRHVVLARREDKAADAERRMRPIAIELIEGMSMPPELSAYDSLALAAAIGRYSRKVRGATTDRIGAYFRDGGGLAIACEGLKARRAWRRASAAYSLGDMSCKEAVPLLLEALEDRNAEVRAAAVRSLGRLRDPSATERLVECLVARQVPRGLGGTALLDLGPTAIPELSRIARHDEPHVRTIAITVLGLVGDFGDAAVALEAMKDPVGRGAGRRGACARPHRRRGRRVCAARGAQGSRALRACRSCHVARQDPRRTGGPRPDGHRPQRSVSPRAGRCPGGRRDRSADPHQDGRQPGRRHAPPRGGRPGRAMSAALETFLRIVSWVALIFFTVQAFTYIWFTLVAWGRLAALRRARTYAPLDEIFGSPFAPHVSVLLPAYNEEAGVVASTSSLLDLRYPTHEVIVINDGFDRLDVERLKEAFDLVQVRGALRSRIPTKPVKAVYVSRSHRNLWVLDKENGGKADALNAGINAASPPVLLRRRRRRDPRGGLAPAPRQTRHRGSRPAGRRRRDRADRQRRDDRGRQDARLPPAAQPTCDDAGAGVLPGVPHRSHRVGQRQRAADRLGCLRPVPAMNALAKRWPT